MNRGRRRIKGFSLIEVALALGVAAFCMVAVMGLLPVGVQTNRLSTSQTAASHIFTRVIADLRATPITTPRGLEATSLEYHIVIPANPVSTEKIQVLYFAEDGTFADSLQSNSRFRLTVTFLVNGTTPTRSATRVYLKSTWPAAADPNLAAGLDETFAALSRH